MLLEYLLGMPIQGSKHTDNGVHNITYGDTLPGVFKKMLRSDYELAHIWKATGKQSRDTSRSGYDMTLMYACLKRGIEDPNDLATILTLREQGSVQQSGRKATSMCRQRS